MEKIANKVFDEERALFHSRDLILENVIANNCLFDLRYPLWHGQKIDVNNCFFSETCRAAIWYTNDIKINQSKIEGVKVIRESNNIYLNNCEINSPEPIWYCNNILVEGGSLNGDYAFLNSSNIKIEKIKFSGKYSFQYVNNLEINDSYLDTKDAFWGSKNIVVRNSIIKGAYLAWYSENLHLINCKIIGTQPLCYCNGLIMENCEMIDCDLSFEYSDVKADIINIIDSIKNPKSGIIRAKGVKEIIIDENQDKEKECIIKIEE